MTFRLIFEENCLWNEAIHDFSVWLITGSNPADINRPHSHTGNAFKLDTELNALFLRQKMDNRACSFYRIAAQLKKTAEIIK